MQNILFIAFITHTNGMIEIQKSSLTITLTISESLFLIFLTTTVQRLSVSKDRAVCTEVSWLLFKHTRIYHHRRLVNCFVFSSRGSCVHLRATLRYGCVVGGNNKLRVHGGERTAKPQWTATRDGDSANVSRPAARHQRIRYTSHAQTHASDAHWHSHRSLIIINIIIIFIIFFFIIFIISHRFAIVLL